MPEPFRGLRRRRLPFVFSAVPRRAI